MFWHVLMNGLQAEVPASKLFGLQSEAGANSHGNYHNSNVASTIEQYPVR